MSTNFNNSSTSSYYLPNSSGVINNKLLLLKKGVWLYFLLLVFEGALRKWFLPGLALPLLVIRDPIALFIILQCWKLNLLPSTPYLAITILVGIVAIFTALFLGHGSLPVAIFGARILLIHFPLTFAIGRIFNMDDVVKIGRTILYISIPMTVLIALQFYSPQSAWVNRGVGGALEGAGFSGSGDYFRPPGTFSFTSGNTLFYSLLTPFVIYFLLKPKEINRFVLLAALLGLICSIPLSISRSLFFQVIISVFFTILAVGRKPQNLGRILIFFVIAVIAVLGLSNLSFFQTATEAFTNRFENANESEGGLNG
ncbi:MAG TPA: hypothetical protein VF610_07715, partial [Segetibacter sp.]